MHLFKNSQSETLTDKRSSLFGSDQQRSLVLSVPRWITCAVVVACLTQGEAMAQQQTPQAGMQQADPNSYPHLADEQAAQRQALGFLGYLDQGRFAESYAYTGMLIRTQVDQNVFAEKVKKARAETGPLQSRELIDSTYSATVPGAPEGQYVVLHYHSSFANRQDAVETLTLALAKGYWRVSGYYIK
jgi:Protein of unknown function (DUF4019)